MNLWNNGFQEVLESWAKIKPLRCILIQIGFNSSSFQRIFAIEIDDTGLISSVENIVFTCRSYLAVRLHTALLHSTHNFEMEYI